jgi:hypothetical protein
MTTTRKPSNRDARALRLIAVEGGLILTLSADKPHRIYTTAASGIVLGRHRQLGCWPACGSGAGRGIRTR